MRLNQYYIYTYNFNSKNKYLLIGDICSEHCYTKEKYLKPNTDIKQKIIVYLNCFHILETIYYTVKVSSF